MRFSTSECLQSTVGEVRTLIKNYKFEKCYEGKIQSAMKKREIILLSGWSKKSSLRRSHSS